MLEMRVCSDYKVRHSEFLGWDRLDRDKAVWFLVRKSETCPGCGTRESEWDEERGGNRRAYRTEICRCNGCEMKQGAEESEDGQAGHGTYVRLVKNLGNR